MKKALLCIWAAAAVFPVVVFAGPLDEGKGYAGGHLAFASYDRDDADQTADPTALIARGGYFFVNRVSVEGRLGFGLADDTVTVFGNDYDVEIDRVLGVYVKGHLPLGDQASVYGIAGLTDGKASVSGPGFSDSDTDSGPSFGVGLDFYTSDTVALNAEYMQYLDEDGYDITALSLGGNFYFQ